MYLLRTGFPYCFCSAFSAGMCLCLLLIISSCGSVSGLTRAEALELLHVHEDNPWSGIRYHQDLEQLAYWPQETKRMGITGLGDEVVPLLLKFVELHTLALAMTEDGASLKTNGKYLFSDAGMFALSDHPSIRYLAVSGAELSDRGLLAAAALPRLRVLLISYCFGVTENGVAEFEKLRPDVRLEVLRGPSPPPEETDFPTD